MQQKMLRNGNATTTLTTIALSLALTRRIKTLRKPKRIFRPRNPNENHPLLGPNGNSRP
jgi:hypothetical protein